MAFGCIIPKRDHRHWRAGVCPWLPLQPSGIAYPATALHGLPRTTGNARFLTWQPVSFRAPQCHQRWTGVFPMLCIGQMERFQPFPFGWRCLPDAPHAMKACTTRRRLGFPSCPGCGIRGRTLGPASENPGRWYPAGAQRSQCSNGREAVRNTSLSKPPKRQDGNRTYTNGCAVLLGVRALYPAENLTFLHINTRKPATSLLRNNLWLC